MVFPGFSLKAVLLLLLSLHLLCPSFALPYVSLRQDDVCEINSICFAIDRSGSINASEYLEEQRFVVAVTRELATRITKTSYSAYGFSTGSVLIQSSTTDLEGTFIPSINAPVVTGGGTFMYSGLKACFVEIKDQPGNRVIVLITDGEDTESPSADEIAPSIKASGVAIVTVGIGSSVSEDYLKGLASNPSLFIPSTFASLPKDVVKVAESSCDAAMMTPTPVRSPVPTPVVEDICEKAYQRCLFRFRGRPTVPTFKLRNKSDGPFTPRIISSKGGQRTGVLNMNNVIPEFLNSDGSVQRITKDTDAAPRFTPTHFKPYSLKKSRGSGIGHQVFTGNQKRVAKKRCIRVFFTHYQVLTNSKPRNVKDNMVSFRKSKNKCVVFRTK